MKRLLAANSGSIFQICKVFRKDPITPLHRREFTMVEWYKVHGDYLDLMKGTKELILYLVRELELSPTVSVMGKGVVHLDGEWLSMSVSEAFKRFSGIDPLAIDPKELRRYLEELGLMVSPEDPWETCLHYLFVAKVEPSLAQLTKPVFLYHYPIALSVMARPSPTDPKVCERVELYVGGIELMNGYSELTDPYEQKRRLEAEARKRPGHWPIDEELLKALPLMPPVAGAALGLERLLMLLFGGRDIGDFLLT